GEGPVMERRCVALLAAVVWSAGLRVSAEQGLTGAIFTTVTDQQDAVLAGAVVQISSPALIGGSWTQLTDQNGQLRFLALPPGRYALDVSLKGFTSYNEQAIEVSAGSTIERRIPLAVAGVTESVVVEPRRSRLDARNPGSGTTWGPDDLQGMPMRRA